MSTFFLDGHCPENIFSVSELPVDAGVSPATEISRACSTPQIECILRDLQFIRILMLLPSVSILGACARTCCFNLQYVAPLNSCMFA